MSQACMDMFQQRNRRLRQEILFEFEVRTGFIFQRLCLT